MKLEVFRMLFLITERVMAMSGNSWSLKCRMIMKIYGIRL